MVVVYKNLLMTANNVPAPYVASASSWYVTGNTFLPFRAFTNTRKNATLDCWATVLGTTTGWLQIDLGEPTAITTYQVTPRGQFVESYFNSAMKDWNLTASNDGVNFDIVHEVRGYSLWNSVTNHYATFEFEDTQTYRYWRIDILANNGNPSYTCIGEFNLGFDIEIDKKIRLTFENTSNSNLYSIDTANSTLIEIINGNNEDVAKYGMKENVTFTLDGLILTKLKTVTRNGSTVTENTVDAEIDSVYQYIGSDPNLVIYSDEEKDILVDTIVDDYLLSDEITELNVEYVNATDNPLPVVDIVANYSPIDLLNGDFELVSWNDTDVELEVELTKKNESSVVTPISDIVMTGINTVDKFEVTANGDVRFTFSVDRGLTYKTYKNGQWINVSDASEGISEDELLALNNDDIQKLLADNYYLRIQYYLKGDLASVDDIKMIASFLDYEIMADTSKYTLDYDIPSKAITVNFKTIGTYSISYMDSE